MLDHSSFNNTVLPALIVLILSFLWLTSNIFDFGKLLKLISKINDDKKIIFPSISFLISPFIAVRFWHLILEIYSDENKIKIVSSIMPLVAVLLFILTQLIIKVRNEINKSKSEESLSQLSLDYLSYLFKNNGELICIEQYLRLLLSLNCHKNVFRYHIELIMKLAKPLQKKLSNRNYLITIDETICQMSHGIEYIFYLKQLEDYLEAIINFDWDNPMLEHDNDKYNKILDWLIEIIKFRVEAHFLGSKLSKKNLRDEILASNIIKNLKKYLEDYNNS